MPKDLHSFIMDLAEKMPSEIKVVDDEVDPHKFHISGYVERLSREGLYPALFFKRVKNSDIPLITNLCTNFERLALALGTDRGELVRVFGERLASSLEPKLVSDGPVHDVIKKGDGVDLYKLPIPVHHELDAGPYITGGIGVCRDLDSGVINLGVYRLQLQAKDQLGIWMEESHHIYHIYRKYERVGKPMPIAIVIGHHPCLVLGAVARITGLGHEYEKAGALMQEPVELVECITNDLLVPSRADVVIEGYVPPSVRQYEGPFAEWPGYYVADYPKPVIKVTAITMRQDAIYYDIFNAHQDHRVLGSLPRMGSVYRNVKEVVPTLVNVYVPPHARTNCYLSIKKERESDVVKAGMAALLTETMNFKIIIVVDDDVDVFDEKKVMWAVGTRFRCDSGLHILPPVIDGGGLLPNHYEYLPDGSRRPKPVPVMLIDATKPLPPKKFPEQAKVPEEAVKLADLSKLRDFDISLIKRG